MGVKIGADPEASPRVPFSAHPYALNSERVNNLQATTTAQANQLLALDSNLNFNIATGTFYGAGLSITGTSTFQNIAFTLATGTTLNLTTALTIGGISLDAIGTNNITSGASLVGVFDEFTNSNSTTVQSVLRDFDVAISSVSSSLYSMTLQQVTFNGNTTTESIQFAGGTSTGDFNPDADLTRNLGTPTNRWNSVQAGDIIANNVSSTNAVFMAATSSNFFVDLFSFNSASGTNLNVQNSTTVNAFVNNLEVLGANITNLDVTNVTTTNFVATNATFTSINVTEPIDLSNLVWVNATGTNTTSTNLYSQKLTALTAAISDLNFGNATGSVMALSSYLAINGIRLDAVGSDNVTSGASIIGIFDEFANSNAATVQAAIRDLDMAISSVSSTLSNLTLQNVTDNGNTTTNAIQFAGGTSTGDLNPDADLTRNLGTPTNRWNSVQAGDIIANNVSSTTAYFTTATSTNFFSDLFTFNTAYGDNLNVQNSTTVNAFVNNLEVLGANITNLDVTNVTTTNFVATNATFTSINVSEPMDLSNLVWVNATGTNTTSTNVYSQKLTALTAAIADLNFGNATGSVMALSSYLAINGIRLDAVGTSNVTSGASLIGIFDEFANSNAVTVQGALRDLDLAISSVSTTMSIFDLQVVTDRGNVTTNAIQFAGGTSTASLSISGMLSVNNVALGSLGTDPTNSGATLSGVFDEFNNFNATTVQSALKAIDTALSSVSSSSSSQQAYFVGFTSSTTDGSFSYAGKIGYQAANAACAAAFAESHFCRTDEVIATIADQDIAALFAAGTYGWIAEGPPGYTANSNDCAGYTSHSNTVLGAFWAYDPNGGGMGWLNNCSVLRQISCCSK